MDGQNNSPEYYPPLLNEVDPFSLDFVTQEYFDHAAFDDRLDPALERAQKSILTLQVCREPSLPILSGEFEPVLSSHKDEQLLFTVTSVQSQTEPYEFTLTPDFASPDFIRAVANTDGSFDVYSRRSERTIHMSGLEAAQLAFRAAGFSDQALRVYGKDRDGSDTSNEPVFQQLIAQAWRRAGGALDTKTQDHIVTTDTFDDVRNKPAEIRLGFKTIETETSSHILLTLEKAFVYPELDAEEAYRLQITYEIKFLEEAIAEKSIRGDGGLAMKSLELIHLDNGGKKTPLDATDPAVLQDFIEAYEVLLSQSTSTQL